MNKDFLATLPPQSIATEEALLGCVLADPQTYDEIAALIVGEAFYLNAHQVIWKAFTDLRLQGINIDTLTLRDRLTQVGELDRVGGEAKLTNLYGAALVAFNVESYAALVVDKWLRRRLISAAREIDRAANSADNLAEVLTAAQQKICAIASAKPEETGHYMSEVMVDAFNFLEQISEGKIPPATSTGFNTLDEKILGLDPGSLCVVAGRPGMGKSAISMQMAHSVARRIYNPASTGETKYKGVAIFSMEMDARSVAQRIWSIESGIPSSQIRTAKLSENEYSRLVGAVESVSDSGLYIDTRSNPSLSQIAATCRQLKQKHGAMGLVVIDYLQLMIQGDDANREIGRITREAKLLAVELECPILLLSQLNRGVESRQNKRPMMSDLRESGAIEQDADLILMLYRDEYYNPDSTPDRGVAEVIIAKKRNGATGTVKLNFDSTLTRFSDMF